MILIKVKSVLAANPIAATDLFSPIVLLHTSGFPNATSNFTHSMDRILGLPCKYGGQTMILTKPWRSNELYSKSPRLLLAITSRNMPMEFPIMATCNFLELELNSFKRASPISRLFKEVVL